MIHFRGKVRKGQQRGKRLGFPTANIPLHQVIPEGIYLSSVFLKGSRYCALTFIGKAETFANAIYQSETYILDFDRDIYGEWMGVHLLKKIRDNQIFVSEEELVEQMKDDKKKAEEYFKNIK